ncbi:hypothetical protein SPAB_00787 [Salmonella enterica subsp. enterica serovar Paratyphi B str. SPB7]|uniref:Uncharacterized protein n=1 Tax=Salmonella paratyphi B (strain ATCC BAA-1250 / SPB7) TaxID=1016998 RepID=A0A6C6YZA5_SALPB|nr:hypothetical protein SPAB_00787 [Salmonella enterica subsp. enterica serovar Paratyphi B str. SPB7]
MCCRLDKTPHVAIRQNGFRRDNKQKHCRSSAFYVVSSGKPREVLPDED